MALKLIIIDGQQTFIPENGIDWLGLKLRNRMENKLHQQIFEEFDQFEKFSQYISKQDAARIAAKIALELAEKGYEAGKEYERSKWRSNTFEDFKKEIL